MTATLEREISTLYDNRFDNTVDTLAFPILERLQEIVTDGTYLHEAMYGDTGIKPVRLQEVPYYYGRGLLLQDETVHSFTNADGDQLQVPTFKVRGVRAQVAVATRDNPNLTTGTAASAGNHGLGWAAVANLEGLEAEIHVPKYAPEVKKDRMRAMGARVLDCYADLPAAIEGARAEQGDTKFYIPPFAHPDVIAGQATVGHEMLQSLYAREALGLLDLRSDDVTILAPVGGGGLATGMAVAFKQARDEGRLGNNVRFIPVQIEDKEHNDWSDGTRTSLGYIASEVLADRRYADDTLTVSPVWVAEAMLDLRCNLKKMIEPAGALALAGALQLGHDAQFTFGSNHTTYVVPVTGTGVTQASFARCYDLQHQAYKDGIDLPSLTSRFVYGEEVADHVSTSYGTHASGILSQNYYGRNPKTK